MNARGTVVLCRPVRQAQATADLLTQNGYECLIEPMLVIDAQPPSSAAIDALALQLAANNVAAVIAVSQNAAEYGLSYVRDAVQTLPCIGVGQSTKTKLLGMGAVNVSAPSDLSLSEDSEGVLSMPILQAIIGKAVVLIRGEGQWEESGDKDGEGSPLTGRTLLATTLRARGALVIELVCYQRHRRTLEAQIRLRLQSLMRESAISAWVIGSTETLDSLLENMVVAKGVSIADQVIVKSDLANQQLLVPHARIAAAAKVRGFRRVAITSLHPKAVLATLNATGTQDLS